MPRPDDPGKRPDLPPGQDPNFVPPGQRKPRPDQELPEEPEEIDPDAPRPDNTLPDTEPRPDQSLPVNPEGEPKT